MGHARAAGRMLSPEQEEIILRDLTISAKHSKEFLKVLSILQNDPELRPLIFEHEALLRALKDMDSLKAEQMLSILTAAETEMYETSKKNEESQVLKSMSGTGKQNLSGLMSQESKHCQTDENLEKLESKVLELTQEKALLQSEFKHSIKNEKKTADLLEKELISVKKKHLKEVADLKQKVSGIETENTKLSHQIMEFSVQPKYETENIDLKENLKAMTKSF